MLPGVGNFPVETDLPRTLPATPQPLREVT